jgi:hypothetical protein
MFFETWLIFFSLSTMFAVCSLFVSSAFCNTSPEVAASSDLGNLVSSVSVIFLNLFSYAIFHFQNTESVWI